MPPNDSSETDPLLPKSVPSPELSQHGLHTSTTPEISYSGHPPDNGIQASSRGAAADEYSYTSPPRERSIPALDDQRPIHSINRTFNTPSQQPADTDPEDDKQDPTEDARSQSALSTFTLLIFATIFLVLLAFWLFGGNNNTPPRGVNPRPPSKTPANQTIEGRVNEILTTTPLIDGHDDLAVLIRYQYHNNLSDPDFRHRFEHGNMSQHVDLPRLRKGQVGGAFWSAWSVCPPNASYDQSDENYATAVFHALEQIDVLRRLQAQYVQDFTPPVIDSVGGSGRDHMLARWHATRSLFGPLSIEGLHEIPPSSPMSSLRHYYDLGVRMATLTWNCHNPFADASIISPSNWEDPPIIQNGPFRKEGALTKRGQRVVREMNRLGMIVDISHTSEWTQRAVLNGTDPPVGSRAPVLFSHSSAYAICEHPRNVKDDVLDLVKKRKGLVMINFSPEFISCLPQDPKHPYKKLPPRYGKNETLAQVVRHILYVGERIGWDHVGLGSDFDGIEKGPRGLEDVSKYPALVGELLRQGVSDADASKVVGGNLLRIWKEIDDVADRMRREGVEPELDDGEGF